MTKGLKNVAAKFCLNPKPITVSQVVPTCDNPALSGKTTCVTERAFPLNLVGGGIGFPANRVPVEEFFRFFSGRIPQPTYKDIFLGLILIRSFTFRACRVP